MSHVYCPECGFQNPEASNYCAKCGTLLVRDEGGSDTTMSYTPDEGEDESGAVLDEIKAEGPALVVRSGGGRAGEHFLLEKEQTTVGRSPDCDVFLDDVTVSRRHALVVRRDGGVLHRGPRQPERDVPEQAPDRVAARSRTATSSRSASTG